MSQINRFVVLIVALMLAGPAFSQDDESGEESGLQYRLLGPVNGGRASRVVGIPDDPSTGTGAP